MSVTHTWKIYIFIRWLTWSLWKNGFWLVSPGPATIGLASQSFAPGSTTNWLPVLYGIAKACTWKLFLSLQGAVISTLWLLDNRNNSFISLSHVSKGWILIYRYSNLAPNLRTLKPLRNYKGLHSIQRSGSWSCIKRRRRQHFIIIIVILQEEDFFNEAGS